MDKQLKDFGELFSWMDNTVSILGLMDKQLKAGTPNSTDLDKIGFNPWFDG